ncbi:uncharacterized protein LOC117338383 [Pecten maximus]|uniref:uncharacterized protein LOC117338383 n=1 Tax=Pecten maximus TaxID=6579 RepID=UPI0014588952|nr:uncharacterized protein LOC117338383 [Pecten maximus]
MASESERKRALASEQTCTRERSRTHAYRPTELFASKIKMASNVINMVKLTLKSEDGKLSYVFFVIQDINDRCHSDPFVSEWLFKRMEKDFPLNGSCQKELTVTESVKILSSMGLLRENHQVTAGMYIHLYM